MSAGRVRSHLVSTVTGDLSPSHQDMKVKVVDPDGNGWFIQEVTTSLPGR